MSPLGMSFLGGLIIGVAVSLMLLFNGRVTGISGIVGALLKSETLDKSWRSLFLLGLLLGGVFLKLVHPGSFTISPAAHYGDYVLAGLLVGIGTLMGNGCTSGHGVCGISRFSIRSIIATITFIIFGIVGVIFYKLFHGEL